jgi:hypothetical protein
MCSVLMDLLFAIIQHQWYINGIRVWRISASFTRTDLQSDPGLCDDMPATNCPSLGEALEQLSAKYCSLKF